MSTWSSLIEVVLEVVVAVGILKGVHCSFRDDENVNDDNDDDDEREKDANDAQYHGDLPLFSGPLHIPVPVGVVREHGEDDGHDSQRQVAAYGREYGEDQEVWGLGVSLLNDHSGMLAHGLAAGWGVGTHGLAAGWGVGTVLHHDC